jgi:type IV pilus assembly protein PilM
VARNVTVGLDIGTHAVYVAEITDTRKGPKLTNFGGVGLPQGAVREGEIIDVDAVAGAIEQLFDDAAIRERRVQVGVSNQRVVVRQVDLPYMEDDELASALRFQVQEYIPIPVDEAELDYEKLEELTGEGDARLIRILLVAADKGMVANHVTAASAAGLRPIGADLNAFAALRAAVPDPEHVAETEMLLDIGAGVTNIIVHEHGLPRFVRILVLGGGDITESLQTELGMTFEEAEDAKMATGLGGDGDVGRLLETGAGEFIDEVRGSLDYYLAQAASNPVDRVIVSGGGSKLRGLPARLEDALSIPVDEAHPLEHLEIGETVYGPDELAEVEPMLTTAIGLALGELR